LGDMVKPTISLFVICAVIAAALAFTYVGTKDVIAQRADMDAENARKEVLSDAERFETVEGLEDVIAARPELAMVKKAYAGMKGDTVAGYVFEVDSKGYGGVIKLTIGIDVSRKITAVRIGDNNETPGLGSKAKEAPFISQFDGRVPGGPLKVVKGGGTKPEEIDAISGATITSKAVVAAVQAAVDTASELMKKEGISG
jgi:electron transport complex protein RnfG